MVASVSSNFISTMRVHRTINRTVPLLFNLWQNPSGKFIDNTRVIQNFSTSSYTCAKELVPSSSDWAPVKSPSLKGLIKTGMGRIADIINSRKKLYQKVSLNELSHAAFVTYEDVVQMIPVEEFFYEFDMPDTFASWFTVIELHLWIVSARLMKEEVIGYHARDMLTEAFFQDVVYRAALLGPRASLYRKKHIGILGYQFTAAYYGYDEGIQSSDRVLAAIVWRRFFGFQCDDAQQIERLVKYIRVQMDHLSYFSFEEILFNRKDNFLVPLSKIRVE